MKLSRVSHIEQYGSTAQTFELVSENPVSGWAIVSATLKGQCIYATSAHLDGFTGLFWMVALSVKVYRISRQELGSKDIQKVVHRSKSKYIKNEYH